MCRYSTHRHGALNDATDFAVVLLKFHPACYLHVFIFGMVLARVRKRSFSSLSFMDTP